MKKITTYLLILICIVSCEKDVYTGLVESSIPNYGKIFVSSNPARYKIFIDNKNWGVFTPDSALYLTEGQHKLNLRHNYFSDTTVTITINKTITNSLFFDMMENPRFYAKIYCSTIPSEAKVSLNDVLINNVVTPTTIEKIYPGKYELKFSRKDCRDDSLNVEVKGGQHLDIQRILEDTTRGVDYRTQNSKIFSDNLSKVVVDKYNNKWVGSIDHGLMKFDGKSWTSYENSGILSSNVITDLLIDSKDRLWVGSAKGLTVFNGATWQSLDNKLPSQTITALEEDPYGNIWIGTNNGLVKYNNSSFQLFNIGNSELPENIITSITFKNNGDMWLGTSQFGVVEFSNNRWTSYFNIVRGIDPSISNYITDLTFDIDGVLWVFHQGCKTCGRNAIMRYDGDWSEFRLPLLFPVEIVSFNVDADQNIWISAKEGLIKYNKTKPIKVFNDYDYSFYVKHCTSISFDMNGDLWVTTMGGGIVKLKKVFL